ncbi:MAG: DUF4390 domain-containing protein [Pseudomonadota bacterium]|jgi:hypothetical protein
MTASITHCWKKRLERTCVLLAGLLMLGLAQAGSIETKRAEMVPDERGYAINAEFAIQIGARLEDAVSKGVPLHFRFEIQIKRKRWYWIDEHVAGRVLKYRLSYQALTRQYRLTLGTLHQNYDTLDEALAALGRVARLHVADKSALPVGEPLVAAVRLSLDHTQLPKPLQVDALADRDWQVEASIHTWQFTPVPEQ